MADEKQTFAELYAAATEEQKQQIRTEVRSAIAEVGLLMSRVHDLSGQLTSALSDSALIEDLTRDTLELPDRLLKQAMKPKKTRKSELSESVDAIEVGMRVMVDDRKGGKYAGMEGVVLFIIADKATLRMDSLATDIEQPVALLRPIKPEEN